MVYADSVYIAHTRVVQHKRLIPIRVQTVQTIGPPHLLLPVYPLEYNDLSLLKLPFTKGNQWLVHILLLQSQYVSSVEWLL